MPDSESFSGLNVLRFGAAGPAPRSHPRIQRLYQTECLPQLVLWKLKEVEQHRRASSDC